MRHVKKAIAGVLIGILGSCGVATYAPASEPGDFLYTSNKEQTVVLYSYHTPVCEGESYYAAKVRHGDGLIRNGCWTLESGSIVRVVFDDKDTLLLSHDRLISPKDS